MRIAILSVLLVTACVARNAPQHNIDASPAIASEPTPLDVAAARGSNYADQIDSLLASVLVLDSKFVEGGEGFQFIGESDKAFQRLARIPESVPRLVECLGWDQLSHSSWQGTRVLVGVVCGHVLIATPYVESRFYPFRLSPELYKSGWGDYHNPSIEKLRIVQKAWRVQLIHDPS